MNGQDLLSVRGVRKRFTTKAGVLGRTRHVDAVRGVDLTVQRGKVLGLAGESGSGKSTVARLIVQLIRPDDGSIVFDGKELRALRGGELREARSHMPMVFQDPYASLDPTKMILDTVAEPLVYHRRELRNQAEELVIEQLERVGLNASHRHRYPYEFSGGQRQRIAIARALISSPKLVIADEPVSALDVSTQAQVLNLFDDLRHERNLGLLFIAHDLAVLRHISDEIAVMFKGRIVEKASADVIFEQPKHPYTRELLDAVPRIRARSTRTDAPTTAVEPGSADSNGHAPDAGCAYRFRCPHAMPRCAADDPQLQPAADGGWVACHLLDDNARSIIQQGSLK